MPIGAPWQRGGKNISRRPARAAGCTGDGGGELVCPPLLTAHEASLLQQFGNAFVPLHAWTVHALHVGFAQEARLRPSPATGSAALSEAADCVLRVRRAIAYIKNTLAMPIPFIYFHTLNLIMYSMYTIFAFAFTSLKVRLRPHDVLARDTGERSKVRPYRL